MYEIRFCQTDESDKLREFLYINWNKNHVFINNGELLKWQYYDKRNDRYNFVVAYNKDTEKFDGILGYIPVSHYDNNLSSNDIWLAIWKINEEQTKGKLSGMDLYYYLKRIIKPNSIAAIGISDIAKQIYELLRYETGSLNHYYFLNKDINNYKIADINTNDKLRVNKINSIYEFRDIRNIEELKEIKEIYKPYKSTAYIKNRYLNHPIYKYKLYGVYKREKLLSVLITRKINVLERSCIRIVDVYGKIKYLENISYELEKLLRNEKCEYIDCLNYGIAENEFYKLGFMKKEGNGIIPNYFEPFERRNVDIRFSYKANFEEYIIFKGDSDQDRPNI